MATRLRLNSDITGVILHHSTHRSNLKGSRVNNNYVVGGEFGVPYDIIINNLGTIDLSPRWIYASRSDQYITDIEVSDIFTYDMHHMAGIGETDDFNKKFLHIALIGDFDSVRPTSIQLVRLKEVLYEVAKKLYIDLRNNFFYHRDLVKTSCPGIFFPIKQDIIRDIPVFIRTRAVYDHPVTEELLPPNLISPENGAIDVSLTPTLLWEELEPGDLYTLQVATDGGFTSIVQEFTNILDYQQLLAEIIHSTEYFWRVKVRRGSRESIWSVVWSFTAVIYYQVLVTAYVPE